MVSVDFRLRGNGVWQPMTLPVSVQAAQTLAQAAKTLKLGDDVKITNATALRPVDMKA